jgi:NAD(P)-dependent dehydrogenase (short-subunit alcohol dehydrogenase family)
MMADRFRLDGRVAMMVGTSANIGTGIAVALGEAGATVACIDKNAKVAELAAGEVEARGGKAIGVQCDTTLEEAVQGAVERVQADFGVVDVLVNGAAFYNFKGIRAMPLEEWRRQLSVILDSAFLVTKEVIERLIAQDKGGSIITLTSTAAYQGEPNNVAYCTAKSGLLNFTRSVAMEVAPFRIRVNSLSPTGTSLEEAAERSKRWGIPGPGDTDIDIMSRVARLLPLGQAPSPSNYGDAAVFLASDAASMVTGLDLRVDAGAVAKYWRSELSPLNSDE